VAELLNDDRVLLTKWIRRLISWSGRQGTRSLFNEKIAPLIAKKFAAQKTPVVRFEEQDHRMVALSSIADLPMRVPVDKHGVALYKPIEREVLPEDCARCELVPVCRSLTGATGVAMLWRRLGLVDARGVPTLRGRIVSFFQQDDGLAMPAAHIMQAAAVDAGACGCEAGGRRAVRCCMRRHGRRKRHQGCDGNWGERSDYPVGHGHLLIGCRPKPSLAEIN
jgi:hypothetical protein